jgi:hypothetical protein
LPATAAVEDGSASRIAADRKHRNASIDSRQCSGRCDSFFRRQGDTADNGSGVPWGQIGYLATGVDGDWAAANKAEALIDLVGLVADDYLNGLEAIASFTAASDDNKMRKIGYTGIKRYLRATITPANNDAGNIFVTTNWVFRPPRKPAANPPT